MKRLLVCWLAAWSSLCAQDAAPQDRTAVNDPGPAAAKGMMADSPVVFPEKGALPARFPPDVEVVRHPAETDYAIFASPCRSLTQIREIQAAMPKITFTPPQADPKTLARTRKRLTEGGEVHLLALGDSIINDTMRSGWIAQLQEAYPQAKIRATVFVRGGGSCRHYREEGRIQRYVWPLQPDVVLIGGISQGKDFAAIREVIAQIRAGVPECEFVLATGAFGTVDPRDEAAMAQAQHSAASDYGRQLQALADEVGGAYLDLTTPWMEAIRSSGQHPHVFYRDRVHANEFGEQILGKILIAWWSGW